MGRTKGATAEATERRLSAAVMKVRQGWAPTEVRDFLMDSEGLSRSQAERYVKDAREYFRRSANVDRQEAIGEALTRLDLVFRTAMESGQLSAALAAQKEKNSLLGLMNHVLPYLPQPEEGQKPPSEFQQCVRTLDSVERERLVRVFEKIGEAFKSLGPREAEVRKEFAEETGRLMKMHPMKGPAIAAGGVVKGDQVRESGSSTQP